MTNAASCAEPAHSATPPAYFDSASGESLHPAARDLLLAAYDAGYADPRRLHRPGRNASMMLDNARAAVAECLGSRPDEVTFTGSGTEAVHRGLAGLLHALPLSATSAPPALVASSVEHQAVLHAARWCQVDPVLAPVDSRAAVDVEEYADLVRRHPGVAALQSANHEVGTRQPIAEVAAALAELPSPSPLLVDAAASMGREPLPAGWSVATGSAHKWGGPPGVGVLVVRKGTRWHDALPTDDRVDPRAVGFENVPAILAAAAALQAVTAERTERAATQHRWIDQIREAASALPDTEVVGDPVDRLPHLVTFSCLYLPGDRLVTELDRQGFAVASGSACSSSALEPSHVLAAMGALTHGNVRVSLGRDTTQEQVSAFCAALPEVVGALRDEVDL